MKLERLVADVTALEHKVATLSNKAMLLDQRVMRLPDVSMFVDRLNDIVTMNMTLEANVMDTASDILAI